MQHLDCHIVGEHPGQAHKEIDVMPETKPNTAKLHGNEGSSRPDRPTTDASGANREFAHQGAAFAKDVSEKTKAAAEETTKVLEQTYSTVTKGAADFNRQWIEMVRANTNYTLDFVHQLLGVKSPAEFFELSSAHARKQFETFADQSKQLTSLAQQVTADAVEPLQAGMKSALTKAA
jgi:phasin